MKQNIKKLKVNNTVIGSIIIIVALVTCHPFHKTSLIDLQKEILAAKTTSDTLKVIDRLEKYYLTMSIPDSIRQRVQAEVDTMIRRHERIIPLAIIDSELDTNIYQAEADLRQALQEAIIARARGADSVFQSIMQYKKVLADTVDSRTDNHYWRPWVAKVENFDIDKAMKWILAEQAESLCRNLTLKAPGDAEKFGAFGLQLLSQVEDARLSLDMSYRLLVILRRSQGLYDLASNFALKKINQAENLKYHLRSTGLLFDYATTLLLLGQNNSALENFSEMLEKAEKYKKVPKINWYQKNGLMGIAKANWHLGNYEKAISICDEVETLGLDYAQEFDIHNTKGISYVNLGRYDKAKSEYEEAFNIACTEKDIFNQIVALQNIGMMYYRLTEYDQAIAYYDRAMTLLIEKNQRDIESRISLLISYAELAAAQNEIEKCSNLIREVNDLIKRIGIPSKQAELLRSVGRLNMKIQLYQQGYNNFQQAVKLYEDYGMLRAELETKTNLVECLVNLSKYQEAKELSGQISKIAADIGDVQREIDATGMLAEIDYQQGNLDKAIQTSNKLIKEVESVSCMIEDIDNLIMFRQKVHHYLKNAVIYEIRKGRIDSAFVKLDYIKARTAKGKLENNNHFTSKANDVLNLLNIKKLKAKLKKNNLIINYFITQDTLYAFLLNQEKIKLLKKAIGIEQVRKLANEYLNSINETIDIFKNYQSATFAVHYDTVIARGQRLYRNCLDWNELQQDFENSEVTYIIPDDILYGIPFSCLMNKLKPDHRFLIDETAILNIPGAFFQQQPENTNSYKAINNKKVLISADRSFPGAAELVSMIKKQFPLADELIIDKPVIEKKDILSKLNDKYEIYFFIGHSVANTKIPDLSSFELTANRKVDLMPIKIAVSLNDFKNIDWSNADMIFLIGCETAIGKLYEGTGFCGFQQSLIARGAKCVLASMWKIDANETFSQIQRFLSLWERHSNPAFALQQVEKETIQRLQQDPYFRNKPHPYIWGSFVLIQRTS